MESKKDVNSEVDKAVDKRVRYLASMGSAFLTDFLAKTKANDRLGILIAAARLAQFGACVEEEYLYICNNLIDGPTETKAANQAAAKVVEMVNKNGDECASVIHGNADGGSNESVPDTAPAATPGKLLN